MSKMQENLSVSVEIENKENEESIVEPLSASVELENVLNKQAIVEPRSTPNDIENMLNEESIVEPLSVPLEIEKNRNEESIVEPLSSPINEQKEILDSIVDKATSPSDDKNIDNNLVSPNVGSTDSSPKVSKSCNDSLDIILIQSTDSSPIINENKENLEPKYENHDQAIIKCLKKMIRRLKIKNLHDISVAKKSTRRDVVDKMSANHKISLNKLKQNHVKLLTETRELYEKRLSDVEKFYVEKIATLEDNRTVTFDALLESKYTLEEQIKKSSENLNSIINIISSYPSSISAAAMKPLSINKNKETENDSVNENLIVGENEDEPKLISQNAKLCGKVNQLETEVYEQKLRITCLENKIKEEIASKGQIQQKLAYTEILYRTTIKEKDELIKNLQEELANLQISKNEMEGRHKEQFLKYDRMLKRSQAEIAVQKREVLALRTQFVPGTPTNFNSKIPSMIKESTPSSSKMSSNMNTRLESLLATKSQLSESTPSTAAASLFSTVNSSHSSVSGAISLSQIATPPCKSLRLAKAPSENSTNSSYATFINSDDSGEPKPKSSRVLRSRRKRGNKSKKGL